MGAADFPFIINSFMFVYMLRAYSLSYCVDIIELHEARIVDKLRHVMYLRSMRLLSCFHEDLCFLSASSLQLLLYAATS